MLVTDRHLTRRSSSDEYAGSVISCSGRLVFGNDAFPTSLLCCSPGQRARLFHRLSACTHAGGCGGSHSHLPKSAAGVTVIGIRRLPSLPRTRACGNQASLELTPLRQMGPQAYWSVSLGESW